MTNYEKLAELFPEIPKGSGFDFWGDFWDEEWQNLNTKRSFKQKQPNENDNQLVRKIIMEEFRVMNGL